VLGGSAVLGSLIPSTPLIQKHWRSWENYRKSLLASLRLPKEISHLIVDEYLQPKASPFVTWRNAFNAFVASQDHSPFFSSDIDIFVIAQTFQEAVHTVQRLYNQVRPPPSLPNHSSKSL